MVRAKKSLGQNFLVDPNIQRKIVEAVGAGPGDEIVEIGPGTGALTRHLAASGALVLAVELDDELAASLAAEFADSPNVRIVHADALAVELETLTEDVARVQVVGNIPYNITSPLIFWLLERRPRPRDIVLMIQREVADRILAPPGDRTYGALSVGVRSVADVERLFHVGRGAFQPVPDVESSVIRIRPHQPPRLSPDEESDLRTLTRAAFGWRRKQFQKILRAAPEYGLEAADVERLEAETGLELERRPESLSPDEFVRLTRALRAAGHPRVAEP